MLISSAFSMWTDRTYFTSSCDQGRSASRAQIPGGLQLQMNNLTFVTMNYSSHSDERPADRRQAINQHTQRINTVQKHTHTHTPTSGAERGAANQWLRRADDVTDRSVRSVKGLFDGVWRQMNPPRGGSPISLGGKGWVGARPGV